MEKKKKERNKEKRRRREKEKRGRKKEKWKKRGRMDDWKQWRTHSYTCTFLFFSFSLSLCVRMPWHLFHQIQRWTGGSAWKHMKEWGRMSAIYEVTPFKFVSYSAKFKDRTDKRLTEKRVFGDASRVCVCVCVCVKWNHEGMRHLPRNAEGRMKFSRDNWNPKEERGGRKILSNPT